MMEFTEALRECLSHYKTNTEFCQEWNIGEQTLYDWLSNKKRLKVSTALVFAIHEALILREALQLEKDACFNCHLRIKG